MSIRVSCPKCRAAFACPDEYRGKALRCKKCGQSFVAGAAAPRKAEPAKPPAPAPRRGLTGGRFAVAALVAVLLGGVIGLPAAWFLLKKHHSPDDIAAGPATDPAPGGLPAPPPTGKQEPPRDTGTKPPPVPAPVAWTEFTSRDWGFGARFPGAPQVVSLPGLGGKRPQTFEGSAPAAPGRKPVAVSVTCEERDPRETADPAAFLEARAAEVNRDEKATTPLKLNGFPGVEVRGAEAAGDAWLATHRFYVVRARAYHLVAGGPADEESGALVRQFLDSFKLLDPGDPEPPMPPTPPKPPSVVAKPMPPKGGLAELQLTAPRGWEANYNKFLGGVGGWEVKKAPPTPRSDGEDVRIEPCPKDALTPADYAAHLKEKDWLNVELPGFIEVGAKEDLPDGFVIKGVVKKFGNAKTPPVLGFVAVRDVGGVKVRCYSANLRGPDSLNEALEMFKGANFAAPK